MPSEDYPFPPPHLLPRFVTHYSHTFSKYPPQCTYLHTHNFYNALTISTIYIFSIVKYSICFLSLDSVCWVSFVDLYNIFHGCLWDRFIRVISTLGSIYALFLLGCTKRGDWLGFRGCSSWTCGRFLSVFLCCCSWLIDDGCNWFG